MPGSSPGMTSVGVAAQGLDAGLTVPSVGGRSLRSPDFLACGAAQLGTPDHGAVHGVGRVRQHRGMKNRNRPIRTGGRSSVDRLPDTLREAVDQAIADGATIDEITARIRADGEQCSRSAVGRYTKNVRDLIRQQQETDRTIKAWVQELGERPGGDTGLFLIETLRTMVLATMAALSGRGEPASLQDLSRLSLILKRIESTEKLRRDRERAAEKEKAAAEKAAATDAGQAKRQGGLSPETVAAIREAVEGPRPPRTVTSVPVDPWNPEEFPAVPANPGESHLIPDDLSESQAQAIRDSHYECWEEIAPRVYRTSPTSILSLGPERAPDATSGCADQVRA